MRRGLIEGDFPLQLHGTAIFSASDPVPLVVFATVDEADTVFRLVSLGFDVSAIVARAMSDVRSAQTGPQYSAIEARGGLDAVVGNRVLALYDVTEPDPELPLSPPTPEGWTLDGAVKPA